VLALGLILVAVAVVLALAEAHVTTGGFIAGAGVIALVFGVTLLGSGAGLGLLGVLAVAAGVLAASAAAMYVIGRSLLSVRSQRPRSGIEAMVGHHGVVRGSAVAPRVYVDGSLWRAQPSILDHEMTLNDGDRVVVERVSGLTLGVRRAEDWELHP
jgi:membrane-bound serine protease (ClpP class)